MTKISLKAILYISAIRLLFKILMQKERVQAARPVSGRPQHPWYQFKDLKEAKERAKELQDHRRSTDPAHSPARRTAQQRKIEKDSLSLQAKR